MKLLSYTLILFGLLGLAFTAGSFGTLPNGFVYVKELIPDLDVEMRYHGSHNFIGKPIEGYQSSNLVLTKQAAEALKKVQEDLYDQNLCLKVYDGYRPQTAVNHFVAWSKQLEDTIMKREFYPKIEKQYLFAQGYIASRSGHSRGSTIDLTLTDGSTGEPLDMGGDFDFFGEESWTDHPHLTDVQKNNRSLLKAAMEKHNFRNYPKEWWHYTLRWEPYPNTYFDFLVD